MHALDAVGCDEVYHQTLKEMISCRQLTILVIKQNFGMAWN